MDGPRFTRGLRMAFTLLFVCVIPLQAQIHQDFRRIGTRDVNSGEYGFPNQFIGDKEIEQASAIDEFLQEKMKSSDLKEVAAYLERLAEEIRRHSDFKGDLKLRLGRNLVHLAFSTMGGYLYVDESIFTVVRSESELAGVLAHEIGHLAARHGAENVSRKLLLEADPGSITTLFRPCIALFGSRGIGGLAGFWQAVRYNNEIEADELGTQYLWKSGFEPQALLNFLTSTRSQKWLEEPREPWRSSSHPPFSLREKKIQAVLRTLPTLPAIRLDSSRFVEIQGQLGPNTIRLSQQ